MRIAVLGLGKMGQAVAGRLLQTGYSVTVWNRTPGKESSLVNRGAIAASSIGQAVRDVDVSMTFLTADAAVKQVYLGENGLLAAEHPGLLLVDMSTISPATSREVAAAVPDGHFIDAPVLGGPDLTEEGKAKLLLGGSEEMIQRLDPLWRNISSGYVYCGANGAATSMKLLSNLILIGSTMFLAEAVAAAQANHISDGVVREVFGSSPAVAPGVRVRLDDVMGGNHEGWWTIKLAEKDLSLALSLAHDGGSRAELGKTAEHLLQQTDQVGFGSSDLGAVAEVMRVQDSQQD